MRTLKKQLDISNQFQRTVTMLIDQQMWCWGCDVRRTDGNFLLLYGAQKRPSPNPRYNSTYVFPIDATTMLNLWSWGVWIASAHGGSLFIARSRFQMRYMRDAILMPDVWRKRDLPIKEDLALDRDDLAHCRGLLATALRWIGTYEVWLNRQVSSDYRDRTLANWPQKNRYKGGIPASEMAMRWFELSTALMPETN